MKEETRSYNLRSKTSRNSRSNRLKNGVSDAVVHRVCKKIAKTIYQNKKDPSFSSSLCHKMASKIEEMVQDQAEGFDDYKTKIVEWVYRFNDCQDIIEEMSGKTDSEAFEEWFRERVTVSDS